MLLPPPSSTRTATLVPYTTLFRSVMAEVYGALDPSRHPIVFTSRRSAELTKYAANAFLALKLAYINEIADLCEKVGADVQDVSLGMGLDSRIGRKFLNAGDRKSTRLHSSH